MTQGSRERSGVGAHDFRVTADDARRKIPVGEKAEVAALERTQFLRRYLQSSGYIVQRPVFRFAKLRKTRTDRCDRIEIHCLNVARRGIGGARGVLGLTSGQSSGLTARLASFMSAERRRVLRLTHANFLASILFCRCSASSLTMAPPHDTAEPVLQTAL